LYNKVAGGFSDFSEAQVSRKIALGVNYAADIPVIVFFDSGGYPSPARGFAGSSVAGLVPYTY
jgi:hypothetical protein